MTQREAAIAAPLESGRARMPATAVERIAFVAVAAAALVAPLIAGEYWLKGILIPTLVFGLAALGLNFVTGYAGLISLGQAAFMAVGAFASVIAYGRYGVPLLPTLVIAGAAAAAIGALVGMPSLRIKGLYLMVATLAAQFVIVWVIQRVPWIGAGSIGTVNTPPVTLAGWRIDSAAEQYYLALAVVAALTLFGWNLARSRVGRAWMAIRDHDVAAGVMGISMLRYKLLAFTVSSFYAGVAGALVVFAWIGAANTQDYGLEVSIQILGMVIIGGLGSVLGSYLGAAFVLLLPILISVLAQKVYARLGGGAVSADILANAQHVLFGVLILIFLIKEPLGLARLWSGLAAALDRRLGGDRRARG